MRRTNFVLALFFSLFASQAANAEFVCGDSMVETDVGTTREEVLEKCGPPSAKDEDHWYYKNQPGQVTVVLTFENNQLQQIEQIPE